MFRNITLISLFFSVTLCFSQEAPTINGAVTTIGQVNAKDLKGLNKYNRLIKIADTKGVYIGTLEVSGYALKDILESRALKKEDDGFDRPLDLYVTAKGKDGSKAVFSYGEIFMGSDEGVLLADGARMIWPTKHPPLTDKKNDPSTIIFDIKKRNSLNLASCASCHDGKRDMLLYFPKGWLLVAVHDGFGGRFLESPTEITVHNAGTKVENTKAASRDSLVESPVLIGPDGKTHSFNHDYFQKQQRIKMADAGIGIGKGYRGTSTWEGTLLKNMLQHLLPGGVNPRDIYVVVTGVDGYRATFSGTEIFSAPDEKCVILVDSKNEKPLGKGHGRYLVMPRTDFFIDRGVKMVKEIRLFIAK